MTILFVIIISIILVDMVTEGKAGNFILIAMMAIIAAPFVYTFDYFADKKANKEEKKEEKMTWEEYRDSLVNNVFEVWVPKDCPNRDQEREKFIEKIKKNYEKEYNKS